MVTFLFIENVFAQCNQRQENFVACGCRQRTFARIERTTGDFHKDRSKAMERFENAVGKENIYRTDEVGTIIIVVDGEKLTVKTEK